LCAIEGEERAWVKFLPVADSTEDADWQRFLAERAERAARKKPAL